jgi:hypothetical protein
MASCRVRDTRCACCQRAPRWTAHTSKLHWSVCPQECAPALPASHPQHQWPQAHSNITHTQTNTPLTQLAVRRLNTTPHTHTHAHKYITQKSSHPRTRPHPTFVTRRSGHACAAGVPVAAAAVAAAGVAYGARRSSRSREAAVPWRGGNEYRREPPLAAAGGRGLEPLANDLRLCARHGRRTWAHLNRYHAAIAGAQTGPSRARTRAGTR